MKKSIISIAISALTMGGMFTACQTQAQKDDAAVAKVKDAKQDLKEERTEANKENEKVATAEEWKVFKSTSELKIRDNENRIAELKVQLKKPGKILDPIYENRIETLEARNKRLQEKMDAYEKNQSDWESFKREYNHDMDELGHALKDFTVDNKK